MPIALLGLFSNSSDYKVVAQYLYISFPYLFVPSQSGIQTSLWISLFVW